MTRPPGITQIVLTLGGGGLEAMAARLAIALAQRGYRSSIIGLDGGGAYEPALRAAGVGVAVLGGRRPKDPRFHWQLASTLRAFAPDVLHTHHFAALAHSALASRLARVAGLVHTEHAYDHYVGRPDYVRVLRLLTRSSRAFVLVGRRMLDFYAGDVGIAAGQLRVIPNGIDVTAYAPAGDRAAARRILSLPEGLLIGAVGRIAPEKNLPLLLRAFATLPATAPCPRLLLVGDGPDREDVEQRAAELGIGGRTHFLGWRADVADILPALDIFALSSSTEGLPLAVLEAMASGVPVLGTAVGDMGEVIDHGTSGLLVAADDEPGFSACLRSLASDPPLRQTLATGGRIRVATQYSHDVMVDRYLEAYGIART